MEVEKRGVTMNMVCLYSKPNTLLSHRNLLHQVGVLLRQKHLLLNFEEIQPSFPVDFQLPLKLIEILDLKWIT